MLLFSSTSLFLICLSCHRCFWCFVFFWGGGGLLFAPPPFFFFNKRGKSLFRYVLGSFSPLPCGLNNEDQLCMNFQEKRVTFTFLKVFSFCSLTQLPAIAVHHVCPCKVFTGATPKANWQRLVFWAFSSYSDATNKKKKQHQNKPYVLFFSFSFCYLSPHL